VQLKLFSFFVFLFFLGFAHSQDLSIKDLSSWQPINGALVFNGKNGKYLGQTDNNGKIKMRRIYNVLIVKHPKYISRKISLNEIVSSNRIIYLLENESTLDEMVISASRFKEKIKDISKNISIIKSSEIKKLNQSSTADLLSSTGSILVQKSQLGGGSPIIRGFETNKILIVIDGVRMNNAIYRSGHLQNVITLDNSIMERIEILYGPGSVVYGSDALGGVINFTTKKPKLSKDTTLLVKSSSYSRYFSAANGYSLHTDFSVASNNIGSLTSITYSDFGNLKQGSVRNPFLSDFGYRNWFVETINGVDSVLSNPDPELQVGSAYKQIDLLQKISIKTGDFISHEFNFQFSTSSDIPRYDRLTLLNGSNPKYSEWYYGPQNRFLGSYIIDFNKKTKMFDVCRIVSAYQAIEESRITRRFKEPLKEHRFENLNVYTLNIDFQKKKNKNELRYGIDAFHNDVQSDAYSNDIYTDSTFKIDTRYPDGGSYMSSAAAYITNSYEHSKNLIFHQGIRYSFTYLKALFIDTSFFPFPFNSVNQQHNSINGNLGLVFLPKSNKNKINKWRFTANAATGFRAPNIDDISKVFESVPGYLLLPNPNLKSEYSYTGEFSIGYKFHTNSLFSINSFFTYLTNAISIQNAQFNGNDSIFYNGEMSRVMMSVNSKSAYIYGFECAFNGHITPQLSINTTLNYTHGRIITDTIPYPLDHIPPLFGKFSVQHQSKRLKSEFFINYSAWKRVEDYNLNGEDNYIYATPYGMPSWYTLNCRFTMVLSENINIQVAAENILDHNYRVFASNISSPGRNFIVTLRLDF